MSLILALILVWILQSIGWLLALFFKKQHLADIFWGPGIALVSWAALMWNGFQSGALILITLLTTVWAGRLAYNNWSKYHGKPEDKRYQALQKNWQNPMLDSYLKVWMLQGGLMILLGMSALSLSGDQQLDSWNLIILGILVWGAGFYFEVMGDRQLQLFKQDPANKNKTLNTGLWSNCRHPNYFGEVVMWWGIWLIAASSGWWWLAILSPITITYLILKVSGIPLAEKQCAGKDGWADYQKQTSLFVPRPSKR